MNKDYSYEEKNAAEGARKKGFFKDLFWKLFVYNVLFVGLGVVIMFEPSIIYADGKTHPYAAITLCCFALILDVVIIWHYVTYSPGKPPRHIAPNDADRHYKDL